MKNQLYCGDCAFHRIKRGKNGDATGEHICVKWDALKSEWQQIEGCSFFKDKDDIEENK